jgi:ABC-type Fe3+/spermidine/putrescine transport system ATPase subunit
VLENQPVMWPVVKVASVISGTGMSVPDRVVTNEHFAKYLATSDEWIRDRTGIRERRWVEGSVTASGSGAVSLDVKGLGPVRVAAGMAVSPRSSGAIALRPEKIRIAASTPRVGSDADPDTATENQFRGTVTDFLYLGDVTVYIVSTPQGCKLETLRANSGAGRAKFFEVGDAVEVGWSIDAGHFITP